MKTIIISLSMMLLSIMGHTQTKMLRGRVTDAISKTPLSGANILVNGEVKSTTNSDGIFTIECKDTIVLLVSFLSYETQEIRIKNCLDELNILLIPSSYKLNEIEITATSNPNKAFLQTPVSIVKLNETELKRGLGLFLDDAINTNVPGVFMERRTISAGQQFNIRGYGNGLRGTNGINSNFDGQGSKVYLNGIPITDAEGITIMDDIDFASLGNVEVSKGPSGTLYGLAISGVVNFQTKKAEKNKISIAQDFMAGSYGLIRSTTHLSIGQENSSFLINYGAQKFDGYMDHTASSKDFVNVLGDFNINEKQLLSTFFGYSNSYDERNGELTIAQYDTLDYTGNSAYIKNDAHSAVTTFRAGISHKYKFSEHISNTTSFFGSSQNIDNSSAGVGQIKIL